MIERTCMQCGKVYKTFPSCKPKYCSSVCAGAAKKNGELVPCAICGKTFYRRPCRPNQSYCSKSCARTAANLTEANPSHHRDIHGNKNPMYGKGMPGQTNPMYGKRKDLCPRWRGGIKVRADGYILIIAPDNHPYPADITPSGTKYILLHRLVMEDHLGRYLEPSEVVHHKDGNPGNNAIENLELFASQSDHIKIGHATPPQR